jgi:hypothetical protein
MQPVAVAVRQQRRSVLELPAVVPHRQLAPQSVLVEPALGVQRPQEVVRQTLVLVAVALVSQVAQTGGLVLVEPVWSSFLTASRFCRQRPRASVTPINTLAPLVAQATPSKRFKTKT